MAQPTLPDPSKVEHNYEWAKTVLHSSVQGTFSGATITWYKETITWYKEKETVVKKHPKLWALISWVFRLKSKRETKSSPKDLAGRAIERRHDFEESWFTRWVLTNFIEPRSYDEIMQPFLPQEKERIPEPPPARKPQPPPAMQQTLPPTGAAGPSEGGPAAPIAATRDREAAPIAATRDRAATPIADSPVSLTAAPVGQPSGRPSVGVVSEPSVSASAELTVETLQKSLGEQGRVADDDPYVVLLSHVDIQQVRQEMAGRATKGSNAEPSWQLSLAQAIQKKQKKTLPPRGEEDVASGRNLRLLDQIRKEIARRRTAGSAQDFMARLLDRWADGLTRLEERLRTALLKPQPSSEDLRAVNGEVDKLVPEVDGDVAKKVEAYVASANQTQEAVKKCDSELKETLTLLTTQRCKRLANPILNAAVFEVLSRRITAVESLLTDLKLFCSTPLNEGNVTLAGDNLRALRQRITSEDIAGNQAVLDVFGEAKKVDGQDKDAWGRRAELGDALESFLRESHQPGEDVAETFLARVTTVHVRRESFKTLSKIPKGLESPQTIVAKMNGDQSWKMSVKKMIDDLAEAQHTQFVNSVPEEQRQYFHSYLFSQITRDVFDKKFNEVRERIARGYPNTASVESLDKIYGSPSADLATIQRFVLESAVKRVESALSRALKANQGAVKSSELGADLDELWSQLNEIVDTITPLAGISNPIPYPPPDGWDRIGSAIKSVEVLDGKEGLDEAAKAKLEQAKAQLAKVAPETLKAMKNYYYAERALLQFPEWLAVTGNLVIRTLRLLPAWAHLAAEVESLRDREIIKQYVAQSVERVQALMVFRHHLFGCLEGLKGNTGAEDMDSKLQQIAHAMDSFNNPSTDVPALRRIGGVLEQLSRLRDDAGVEYHQLRDATHPKTNLKAERVHEHWSERIMDSGKPLGPNEGKWRPSSNLFEEQLQAWGPQLGTQFKAYFDEMAKCVKKSSGNPGAERALLALSARMDESSRRVNQRSGVVEDFGHLPLVRKALVASVENHMKGPGFPKSKEALINQVQHEIFNDYALTTYEKNRVSSWLKEYIERFDHRPDFVGVVGRAISGLPPTSTQQGFVDAVWEAVKTRYQLAPWEKDVLEEWLQKTMEDTGSLRERLPESILAKVNAVTETKDTTGQEDEVKGKRQMSPS